MAQWAFSRNVEGDDIARLRVRKRGMRPVLVVFEIRHQSAHAVVVFVVIYLSVLLQHRRNEVGATDVIARPFIEVLLQWTVILEVRYVSTEKLMGGMVGGMTASPSVVITIARSLSGAVAAFGRRMVAMMRRTGAGMTCIAAVMSRLSAVVSRVAG